MRATTTTPNKQQGSLENSNYSTTKHTPETRKLPTTQTKTMAMGEDVMETLGRNVKRIMISR